MGYYWLFFLLPLAVLGVTNNDKERGFCLDIFDVSNRTIIKASESVKNGAVFLEAEPARGRLECEKRCCDTPNCNIAVFQEIKDRDCYLFDCGKIENFKCVFSVHENYVAMGMMMDRAELQKTLVHEQAKHEADLSLMKVKTDRESPQTDQPPIYREDSGYDKPRNNNYDPPPLDPASYDDRYRYRNRESNYREPERPTYEDRGTPTREDYGRAPEYNTPELQQPPPGDNGRRRPPLVDPRDKVKVDYMKEARRNEDNLVQQKPNSIMDKSVAKPQSPFKARCGQYQWQCGSGECIAEYDLCTRVAQCKDGSDENADMCRDRARVRGGSSFSYEARDRGPPPNNPPPEPVRQSNFKPGQIDQFMARPTEPLPKPVNLPSKVLPKGVLKSGDAKDEIEHAKTHDISTNEESPVAVPVDIESSNNTSFAGLMLGLGLSLLAIFLVFISCRVRRARSRLRKPGGKVLNTGEGEYLINGMYL